ncbi:Glutamyl-tRNA(Gln) synthetase [hydrothermal vent metagenome]|uniref:Glutamyl-tRNA(Gln) synthetase n=1 Tax=hydrothermal vent metagenome TaxID=652676 RepID=A0A1W1CQM7_9ZZZZ
MILEKFAIIHNSVFHQSEHLNLHQTLALRLLKEDKAFICICNNEDMETYSGNCEKELNSFDYKELKESKKPFVIRIKKPTHSIIYNDIIKGSIETTPNKIDSFIILKSDGTPTYNFACACDDMLSNIDFIISEEKNLNNSAKQIHIKNILGYKNESRYAHLAPILNQNDETLSIKNLLKEGFLPDAILNYLILLDNPKAPKEIFTLPEAIEWFDLNNIPKVAVKFDIDKLRLINKEHIRSMDDRKLSTIFGFADSDIGKLAKLYLEECSTINEIEDRIYSIFNEKNFDRECGDNMKKVANIIANSPAFDEFNEFIEYITEKSGLKDEKLFTPLRYLFTNKKNSPQLSEIYPLIKSYILKVAS